MHIHCPCPTGWKSDVSKTVDISKLAVETGMWILYEIEDGVLRITKRVNDRKPVEEYLKLQGRFKHLKEPEIKKVQERTNSEYRRMETLEDSKLKIWGI